MIKIKGTHNTALVFTNDLEPQAEAQIQAVCDQEAFSESKIRIMPDVHAGMGCTIGTTMTIIDKIVPGMVGVDIGCGIETVKIDKDDVDFDKLDKLIRREIPSGRDIRKKPHSFHEQSNIDNLRCWDKVKLDRARHSIGTLGGGNHFIEIAKDEEGTLYAVVHSGSRHIGHEVATYYQNEAVKQLSGISKDQVDDMIAELKAKGRKKEIDRTLRRIKREAKRNLPVPKDLTYVEGQLMADYLHDMEIIQNFAKLNRQAMVDILLKGMGWEEQSRFTTIHNYVELSSMILRKGAVSAKLGEKLLIPINMRDGSLICEGLGNEDWNYSAPHGAGRLMSRRDAFRNLNMKEYKSQMVGIFTTSVHQDTLDEAPMAYKSMDFIKESITPTAKILHHIKPLYNFKASE
ncbi:MAG: RtcB family protein [Christensenellaceae bacterium]|nr:RtcB family protein [Christensenellaceae bacterium]